VSAGGEGPFADQKAKDPSRGTVGGPTGEQSAVFRPFRSSSLAPRSQHSGIRKSVHIVRNAEQFKLFLEDVLKDVEGRQPNLRRTLERVLNDLRVLADRKRRDLAHKARVRPTDGQGVSRRPLPPIFVTPIWHMLGTVTDFRRLISATT
jgi:hypothetical protein